MATTTPINQTIDPAGSLPVTPQIPDINPVIQPVPAVIPANPEATAMPAVTAPVTMPEPGLNMVASVPADTMNTATPVAIAPANNGLMSDSAMPATDPASDLAQPEFPPNPVNDPNDDSISMNDLGYGATPQDDQAQSAAPVVDPVAAQPVTAISSGPVKAVIEEEPPTRPLFSQESSIGVTGVTPAPVPFTPEVKDVLKTDIPAVSSDPVSITQPAMAAVTLPDPVSVPATLADPIAAAPTPVPATDLTLGVIETPGPALGGEARMEESQNLPAAVPGITEIPATQEPAIQPAPMNLGNALPPAEPLGALPELAPQPPTPEMPIAQSEPVIPDANKNLDILNSLPGGAPTLADTPAALNPEPPKTGKRSTLFLFVAVLVIGIVLFIAGVLIASGAKIF